MDDEEGHGGTTGSSATIAQPLTSQYPLFHQISSPPPLALRPSGEVADNWKLWRERYNNYFVFSRLDRESSPYQLVMFKNTIGDDALKVIQVIAYERRLNFGGDKGQLEIRLRSQAIQLSEHLEEAMRRDEREPFDII